MGIVAADHHPVGADAFGDVGPCRIVRAEREIEIAETFFGATPRLLSCGRAGVVGGFEAIHQPRNKPDADFEETPAKFWKAIDHATKISAEIAVKTSNENPRQTSRLNLA